MLCISRNTIVSSYCLFIIILQLKSLKFENKENYFQTRAAGLLLVNFFSGERQESIKDIYILFNRDLNHGCFVYMFSLLFSGSKFLINLRRQFGVRKIFFVYLKFFVQKVSWDLQSFHFV